MVFTYGNLILLIGVLMTIVLAIVSRAGKKVETRKKAGTASIIFAVVAMVGVLSLFVAIPGLNNEANFQLQTQSIGGTTTPGTGEVVGSGSVATTGSGISSVCVPGSAVSKTTVKLSAANAFTGAASGGSHAYKINDGPTQVVSDGGTFDTTPGVKLTILLMNESNSAGYFGKIVTVPQVPCQGTYELPAENSKVYANGTVTMDLYSRNNQVLTIGSQTGNESMNANDDFALPVIIRGTTNAGQPYNNVVTFEYNSTAFSTVELRDASGLNVLPVVATPSDYVQSLITNRATRSFQIGPIIGSGDNKYQLRLVAGSSPPLINDLNSGGINGTMEFAAPYINGNLGGIFADAAVMDESNRRNYLYTPRFNFNIN